MSSHTWHRSTLLAITGVVVLSSAACGGSENPAATTVIRHAGAKDRVGGLVSSVSGHTVQVATPGGSADIDFNAMTKITEVHAAELSDVVVGSCVSVLSAAGAETSGETTAQRVLISASEDDRDNRCALDMPPGGPPPGGVPPGPPPDAAETPPPAFGGPSVQGAVASVDGTTIVVTNADPTEAAEIQTNVTVTADTKYDKRQHTESTAITTGKCADARGTRNPEGTLQATTIDLGPANDGQCGPP